MDVQALAHGVKHDADIIRLQSGPRRHRLRVHQTATNDMFSRKWTASTKTSKPLKPPRLPARAVEDSSILKATVS